MYRFAICDDDSQFASLLKEALITNLNGSISKFV